MTTEEVKKALDHFISGIDHLQRVIDCLDGSGKDTDIDRQLALARHTAYEAIKTLTILLNGRV